MFQNKNWFKVLVPQAFMTALTLAVFFVRWLAGMENAATAAVAGAAIAATAAVAGDKYKLPKFWVALSYLAVAAAVFFPIYFTLS